MPQVIRHTARKEKGTEVTLPQFSSAQYVPRQEFEELASKVEALQNKLTVTYGKAEEKLTFPTEVMEKLPNVVKKTIKGVMLNYEHDYSDFCFWGMRKALIDAIHIRFRKDEKESLLYDEEGNAYSLPRWIDLAKQQRYISRHLTSELKGVKIFGDEASHDYMTDLQKEEVPPVFLCLRMALSRLFYEE